MAIVKQVRGHRWTEAAVTQRGDLCGSFQLHHDLGRVDGSWSLVAACICICAYTQQEQDCFFPVIQADVHHSFPDFSLVRYILYTYIDIKYTLHSFNVQNRKLSHI